VALRVGPFKNDSVLPLAIHGYSAIVDLPDPASFRHCLVMLDAAAGSKQLIFSDGTRWRYPDGTAV
jgi:hypothetical protein